MPSPHFSGLRREDIDRLDAALGAPSLPIDHILADRLNAALPPLRELCAEIVGDLSESTYGIGWWADHLPTRARIYISDYLYQATNEIETNLVEARLHASYLNSAWDQESRRIADAVELDAAGNPRFTPPTITSAVDTLPGSLARLHLSGYFRALASAMDCLAASAIGVAALPRDLRKADYNRMKAFLGKLRTESPAPWKALREQVDAIEDQAGPARWVSWALGYRNVLVHRGRRTNMSRVELNEPVLYRSVSSSTLSVDPRFAAPVVRAHCVPQLSVDPTVSDVEALVHHRAEGYRGDHPKPLLLEEDAHSTVEALFGSVRFLCTEMGAYLLDLWRRRRERPDLLRQPAAQWKEQALDPFGGFEPGTAETSVTELHVSPTWERRLVAAALTDKDGAIWKDRDE